jgi:RNA polymerase sigma factor (sigma-70 family)
MATTFGGFLQQLRKAMAAETLASYSDCQLIQRFLTDHDEAAFHALLRCHGPMVMRVCRRVLGHEQDVEDAFQATFLVLAREARGIRKHQSIASWLHGVAYRLSLNARKANTRRRKHETHAAAANGTTAMTDEVGWKELRAIFDEELVKLPERVRAPLVLCYLEGLTQDEAAERLGQTKSTFRRNLERGRELLGSRLTRRGVTLSAALFAPLLSECAASGATVPAALAASTMEYALALAAGKTVTALASARALALAQGLAQPVLSAKVKCVCGLLLAAGLLGFGGAALPGGARPVEPQREHHEVAKAEASDSRRDAKADEPKRSERIKFRDPLLVLRAEVQTELKLDAEQKRKIRDLMSAIDAHAEVDDLPSKLAQPGASAQSASKSFKLPGTPADPAHRRVAEKRKALQEALPDILTGTQAVRLRQLERQMAGAAKFQDPENVKLLALTDEQRDKVRTIIAQARQVPHQRDGRVVDFDYQKADKAAVQQILEMLTADQQKTWRDLTGEAFDVGSLRPADLFPPPGSGPPLREGVPVVTPQAPDPDGERKR